MKNQFIVDLILFQKLKNTLSSNFETVFKDSLLFHCIANNYFISVAFADNLFVSDLVKDGKNFHETPCSVLSETPLIHSYCSDDKKELNILYLLLSVLFLVSCITIYKKNEEQVASSLESISLESIYLYVKNLQEENEEAFKESFDNNLVYYYFPSSSSSILATFKRIFEMYPSLEKFLEGVKDYE